MNQLTAADWRSWRDKYKMSHLSFKCKDVFRLALVTAPTFHSFVFQLMRSLNSIFTAQKSFKFLRKVQIYGGKCFRLCCSFQLNPESTQVMPNPTIRAAKRDTHSSSFSFSYSVEVFEASVFLAGWLSTGPSAVKGYISIVCQCSGGGLLSPV